MAQHESRLDNWFTHHPPHGNQPYRYSGIRQSGRRLAEVIEELAPSGPEKEQALAKVREAVMWANAAIACNESQS
jgi:hypothetical protein